MNQNNDQNNPDPSEGGNSDHPEGEGGTKAGKGSSEFKERMGLEGIHRSMEKIRSEIRKILVGQDELLEKLMIALLADGHVLIEGVPGVAKTLVAKMLARTISADFSRIQFTPDLMPSDVTGTSIYDQQKGAFTFKKGPIFSNIILVDEINRAPAKTQAALFEVMEERQVTIDGHTYVLEPPFNVFATQNPIEQEGTYRLPEAQLDRFLFKVNVGYPNEEDEHVILKGFHENKDNVGLDSIDAVLSTDEIKDHRQKTAAVHIDDTLLRYIASVVSRTREHSSLFLGASPRASLSILMASKAKAAIKGRDFVTPDDIKYVTPSVMAHRVILTPEKEMEGDTPEKVVKGILESIEVPR